MTLQHHFGGSGGELVSQDVFGSAAFPQPLCAKPLNSPSEMRKNSGKVKLLPALTRHILVKPYLETVTGPQWGENETMGKRQRDREAECTSMSFVVNTAVRAF